MSDKKFKNLKKIAPFLFGIIQIFGNAVFSLSLAIFMIITVIIGGIEIHSLNAKIEKFETQEQNIVELQKEVEEQRKILEILINDRKEQKETDNFNNILDKFLERTIKLSEKLQKQSK